MTQKERNALESFAYDLDDLHTQTQLLRLLNELNDEREFKDIHAQYLIDREEYQNGNIKWINDPFEDD